MSSALMPDPAELAAPAPVKAGEAAGSMTAGADARALAGPGQVTRHLVSGTSALGLGVVIERGTGLLANVLAARLGGLATFGAYSFAISTANNIATYAAAGIGATAARFSGKYQYGSSGYSTLARVLTVVSMLSAAVAAIGLWLGARPIAHFLEKDSLVGLLHWAALSAAGMVLLECARGFFVGQRRLRALVLLSVLVGAGMLSLLPLAARQHSPVRMIVSQGATTVMAVLVCLLLAGWLGLHAPSTEEPARRFRPMLREVWTFGAMQLAGLVGANISGWWLTALVARADHSFVQMSFFSVASQLRNVVGLAPSLLTEGSFAIMADPAGESSRTPQQVLGFTTFASSLAAMVLAAAGIVTMPWLLGLYGSAYSSAAVTVSIGLALAVMHMGNAPASARLSILSIRASAVVNTLWALFVAGAGTALMLHDGSAATAMTIYLVAHALSALLVLVLLARQGSLPRGLPATYLLATSSTTGLAGLAALRAGRPELAGRISLAMLLLATGAIAGVLALGRRYGWLPNRAALARLARYLRQAAAGVLRRRPHAA